MEVVSKGMKNGIVSCQVILSQIDKSQLRYYRTRNLKYNSCLLNGYFDSKCFYLGVDANKFDLVVEDYCLLFNQVINFNNMIPF